MKLRDIGLCYKTGMETTFDLGTADLAKHNWPIGMVAFSKLNCYHSRELETYVTPAKHHEGLGSREVVEEYKVTV